MALTICIIEDDEGIQDVLRIILNKAGYATNIYSDGKVVFQNNFTLPDLFLIDKQLAGADGLVICKQLKDGRQTKSIPVIMMSAYPNIREFSILAGANDFIEKPFKIESLLTTIRNHIPETVPTRISA